MNIIPVKNQLPYPQEQPIQLQPAHGFCLKRKNIFIQFKLSRDGVYFVNASKSQNDCVESATTKNKYARNKDLSQVVPL